MAVKEKGFTIEVSSRYEGWWRYNVALMCGCFDAADNRTGFASTCSEIAPVGANLKEPPATQAGRRHIALTTDPCDHLMLYVYIIPHTLPADNDIEATRPFDVEFTHQLRRPAHTERKAPDQPMVGSLDRATRGSRRQVTRSRNPQQKNFTTTMKTKLLPLMLLAGIALSGCGTADTAADSFVRVENGQFPAQTTSPTTSSAPTSGMAPFSDRRAPTATAGVWPASSTHCATAA